jgi:adenine phosphoribosyltransferase
MSAVVSTVASGEEYKQDGPEAVKIASVIPYYPFHGVPRFYDISGMTHNPEVFQLCIDVFVRRYMELGVDCIAGLDARGFVLGPPIALALQKPFIMIRKVGKLPNAVTGSQYQKEYVGDNAHGGDELCISRTAIQPGARVLVIGKYFLQSDSLFFYFFCCYPVFIEF